MIDTNALEGLQNLNTLNIYKVIADYTGISIRTIIFFFSMLIIWALVWKGFALWKSGRNTKPVWFIAFLISQTYGILEIPYLFLFSKIKDDKHFKKIHDVLLIISIIFVVISIISINFSSLLIWKIIFFISFILSLVFLALFSISLLQESYDRKNLVWLIFGILLMPIVPVIYYFVKVRSEGKAKSKPKKKK